MTSFKDAPAEMAERAFIVVAQTDLDSALRDAERAVRLAGDDKLKKLIDEITGDINDSLASDRRAVLLRIGLNAERAHRALSAAAALAADQNSGEAAGALESICAAVRKAAPAEIARAEIRAFAATGPTFTEMAEWLSERASDGADCDGALNDDTLGAVSLPMSDIAEIIDQTVYPPYCAARQLRAVAATDVQKKILSTAELVGFNDDETLVRDRSGPVSVYRAMSWTDYGAALSRMIADYLDPARYSADDYIEMMSGQTRTIVSMQ